MKKFIHILICLFLCSFSVRSQAISWDYNATNPASVVPSKLTPDDVLILTVSNISSVTEFDDFVQKSTFQVDAGTEKTLETALKAQKTTAEYTLFRNAFTINDINLLDFLENPLANGNIIHLKLKDKVGGGIGNIIQYDVPFEEKDEDVIESSGDLPEEIEEWLEEATIKFGEGKEQAVGDIYKMESRYDNNNDRAYLFVDENGSLIGNAPVNIDQDDVIYVIVIGKKAAIDKCNVDFIGSYSPVDLQMRSFEPIAAGFKPNSLAKTYKIKVFRRGPFTSESVNVKIKKNKKAVATYTLRINKLFSLGFGIGINITDLENPEYEISPLTESTKTILEKNAGKRTIYSFNVIWYWRSTYRYLFPGSNITRGRDVLKEPSFWERINPSFGFSLNNDFSKNLFFGGNFEFARGGTINLGYHWGKVRRLNISNFEFGQTTFEGNTIPITEKSDGRFFIGIMIDTRIFNQLFAGAK